MSLHIFGIRHHGPGCARALRAALEELRPDALLIEGPPEGEPALSLLLHEEMKPPVAMLLYVPDQPKRATFYPFAEFSPEWQALRYGLSQQIPTRFIDLPMAITLARSPEDEREAVMQDDPIGVLAEAAGYTDRELWWEHQIEQRGDAAGLFDGILEAMREVRSATTAIDEETEVREAAMRSSIRSAMKEGFERIAVVCGAWHAPVLDPSSTSVKQDQDRLRGREKVKVACTWIPWSDARLSYRSGYGAGIASPSWYRHLWTTRDRAPIRWVASAAQLLRGQDLDASSANVIESVRLAEALASMRELPMPGLNELNDAIWSVLCQGQTTPMHLIRERLEIGNTLGAVPRDTPAVPLQRDVEAKQKTLRMKPSEESKRLELDLRNDNDRARSKLLHQLQVLGIPWGTPQRTTGKGTFHEAWQLQWHVEFPLRIIEANVWGNDTEAAASAFVRERALASRDMAELTSLLHQSVLADLAGAIETVVDCVQSQAAVAAEVVSLMNAMPAMAQVARYGDVRGTAPERLLPVLEGIFERIVVGLAGAASALDYDAATKFTASVEGVHGAVLLLERESMRDEWLALLDSLSADRGVHALLRGWSCRVLADRHAITNEELERRAGLELSRGAAPADAASWLEGVLRGSATLLVHEDAILRVIDGWLSSLDASVLVEVLPLVRRSFARFESTERRVIAEKVSRNLGASAAPAESSRELDEERASRVLPVLRVILGRDDL